MNDDDDDGLFFLPVQVEEWKQLLLPMNIGLPDHYWTLQEAPNSETNWIREAAAGWADDAMEAIAREHDEYFWPHKNGCPVCGSDAYVGLSRVECCNMGCQNWFYREGM